MPPTVNVSVVVLGLYESLITSVPAQMLVEVVSCHWQSLVRAIGLNEPAMPPQFEQVPLDGAVTVRL